MKTIVQLVNLYSEFEEDNPELSIEDFCIKYLAGKASLKQENNDYLAPLDGQLGELVGKLNSFASLYCKKALLNVGLNNVDDWAYLISLSEMKNPKKSELIYKMVSEFPSGMDIIKRLVVLELVEEYPDEDDRRSKRLKITEKGVEVLLKSLPIMFSVGQMTFGIIPENEKVMVLNILKRLDVFHSVHYKDIRTMEFQEAFNLLTKK